MARESLIQKFGNIDAREMRDQFPTRAEWRRHLKQIVKPARASTIKAWRRTRGRNLLARQRGSDTNLLLRQQAMNATSRLSRAIYLKDVAKMRERAKRAV